MAVDLRIALLGAAVFLLCSSSLYASRVKDLGSSGNGVGQCINNSGKNVCLCPDSQATPFLAQLDGTQSPPQSCTPGSDPNMPDPPSPYPNRVVVLTDAKGTFTVTITPVLWERGDGQLPVAQSKKTILQVQFQVTGQQQLTLRSLVVGTVLNNPRYTLCDPNNPTVGSYPYCVTVTTTQSEALEATPVALADTTTTRWDFYGFTSGSSNLDIVVDGFPSEFQGIDIYPNSNPLTPASFSPSNFLAVVQDAGGNTLTAGGLILPAAPAATNDLYDPQRAPIILPFHAFVDTSATYPQENPDGSEFKPQQDPPPTCSPYKDRVFRSVWYTLTGTGTPVTISTQGSRYDTLIYVFTGSPESPTPVACNDDGLQPGTGAVESYVTFNAEPNTTYSIMISETPPDILDLIDGSGKVAVPLSNDATLNLMVVATPGLASYDSTLRAPLCSFLSRWCDSGPSLLLGNDDMMDGAELNQPNTIDKSCADGTAGRFHFDESIDRLKVAATSGATLRRGTMVRVSATVWVADPTQDALDLYYTTNANNPDWIYVATLLPQASGSQTLSAFFRLGPGRLQAVRANFRKGGTTSSCSTGSYDDHDDLVFAVH